MEYINFPKNKQTEFLRLIKRKTEKSWEDLASFLEISRSMIFFYLNEHSKLSYQNYIRLCELANLKVEEKRLVEIRIL